MRKFVWKITRVHLHSWDLGVPQKAPPDGVCFQCNTLGGNLPGFLVVGWLVGFLDFIEVCLKKEAELLG